MNREVPTRDFGSGSMAKRSTSAMTSLVHSGSIRRPSTATRGAPEISSETLWCYLGPHRSEWPWRCRDSLAEDSLASAATNGNPDRHAKARCVGGYASMIGQGRSGIKMVSMST